MSDLQISLIVIGAVIVIAVISFNKWQEHRARKSVERAFATSHDDVLMTQGQSAPEQMAPETIGDYSDSHADTNAGAAFDRERREPAFLSDAEPLQDAHQGLPADEMVSTPAPSSAGFASAPAMESVAVADARELPIDYLIDCTVPIALSAPLRGEKILPVLQGLRHVGNKPVHFVGQKADGGWDVIAHGGVYSSLMAGVQLATRSSALNELEYSEFVRHLRQITDDLDADPDVPDMTEVLPTARSLHNFVTEYDAKLSVNVQSNGAPWSVTTLLAALERQGFDVRPEGRMVMPDGDGGVLFSLSTNVTLAQETTHRLTLLLDVPAVAQERDGFGAMTSCARSLAVRLDGTVVDDGSQPLSDASLNEIAGQLDVFYADMEAADIPAGSSRALRLFN
jgi:FtsZ-interacting cell division protein ZipA